MVIGHGGVGATREDPGLLGLCKNRPPIPGHLRRCSEVGRAVQLGRGRLEDPAAVQSPRFQVGWDGHTPPWPTACGCVW